MRCRATHCVLLCAILLAMRAAAAQATYTIAGTVVSGYNGEPMQNAAVRLADTATSRPLATTTADQFGRFRFSGLAAGAFQLLGGARGYLETGYEQHGVFSTAILTGAGVDTESLVLTLRALGAISGTITDEDSEPLRNAQIHLFHRDREHGDGRFVPVATIITDDLGHYQSPELEAGLYFLAVTASPWYAVHPPVNDSRNTQPFGIAGPFDSALDVAYPVTYFPRTTDQTQASAIHVDGRPVTADLQLTPLPAVTVTIPRPPAAPDKPQSFPQLRVSLFGNLEFMPSATRQTQSESVISGLAPGNYLLGNSAGPNSGGTGGTAVRLSPDAPTVLPPEPARAHVHLNVRSADGSPLPAHFAVGLVHPGARDGEVEMVDPKGDADFAPGPGTYYVELDDNVHLFVHQTLVAGKLVPGGAFDVPAGGTVSVAVTALAGTHTLKGFVRKGGKPLSGAMLLLLPAEPHSDVRRYFRQQSDLDGSFDIVRLPPGPYLLLALEDAWDLDWTSPEFLAHHLPHATPVLIPPSTTTYTLPAPIQVQQP